MKQHQNATPLAQMFMNATLESELS